MNTQTNNATLTGHEIFLEAWNNATKIEFNPEWKNGTGYLDHATNDPELNLEAGTFVATTDDYGRKVLIKGLGQNLNQVVFERGRGDVLVSNLPSARGRKGLDIFSLPYTSSLANKTVQAFLGLTDHTVLFHTDFSDKVLQYVNKDVLVKDGQQLVKDIEEGNAIPLARLKELGIDMELFEVYFNVKQTDIDIENS